MCTTKMVLTACMVAALAMGCSKKEAPKSEAPAPQEAPKVAATTAGEGFSATLPSSIAGKTIGIGGKANAEMLNKKKLDKVADVKSEDGFEMEGWAVSDTTKTVPDTVVIELVATKGGAKYYATASRKGRERADVAKFFKDSAFNKSGYTVNADIKSVPPGEYEIIVIQLVNGAPVRAYPGKKINKLN
jgi:hypothetical protein